MKKGFIVCGENVFETLVASSREEQEQGLMFIEPPVPTMTFSYVQPHISKFWMHNTPSELDIVFCCNGVITEICKGNPFSTAMIGSNNLSDMIVEFPFGTVKKFAMSIGDKIKLET